MPTSSRAVLHGFAPAVPSAVAALAEAWTAGQPAAVPRPSASVVLIRAAPADGALEVFLLHRHARMAFAASMAVFPGGGLEPAVDGGPDPLRACAVRETEEETGVRLAPDALHPWARWTTPEVEPRRYATTFYLAVLPDGQHAVDASTETDRAAWIAPRAALVEAERGDLGLMPPTRSILTELAELADPAAALAAAVDRIVEPVLPRLRRGVDGWEFDYGVGEGP